MRSSVRHALCGIQSPCAHGCVCNVSHAARCVERATFLYSIVACPAAWIRAAVVSVLSQVGSRDEHDTCIKIYFIIYAYESTVSKSLIYERIRMRIEDEDESKYYRTNSNIA